MLEPREVVKRLQNLRRGYRERFQTARPSALMLRIIDLAFERLVRSITDFAEALGVSYGGAANNVGGCSRRAWRRRWAGPIRS